MLWTTHLPCRRRLRGMWCSVAGTTNRMLVATVAALKSTHAESQHIALRSRRVLGCGVVLLLLAPLCVWFVCVDFLFVLSVPPFACLPKHRLGQNISKKKERHFQNCFPTDRDNRTIRTKRI